MKYSALLQLVTPRRRTLLLILFLLLCGSAVSLANPWIAGLLTEALLNGPSEGTPSLRTILVAWLGLVALRSLLGFSSQYVIGTTGEQMLAGLRSRLYDHLQFLPMRYFHERSPGDTLALLSNEASVVSRFVTGTLVQLLPLSLTFVGASAIMFALDVQIALLAALLLPVYFLAMKLIGRRLRPLSSAWMESYSRMFSLVEENIGMLPAIKAFVREKLGVYPGFPTLFWGLSGFFVNDLMGKALWSSWKTRSVFQGAVGAFCASTAPSASTGPICMRQDRRVLGLQSTRE